MKKNQYIQPKTTITCIAFQQHLMAGSNEYQNDAINLNQETMGEGNGSDGASRRSVWDEEDENY